ncbi:alpha/beta hydrolase [Massilia sp. G4R7]|uniref:Alpha/beta hydrolase n=1 Tax=Massilia phyllostachyos TaxID=2898585 RepID=A0ABS8Q8M2_9BURK|nr:alpha/beta hydrolase [Massilia phyllostachyos]MCD2518113.1 alpha/beta hydrolase [Massilia phyllostachyos]
MSVQVRNSVHVSGSGAATMVFSHGFGCDQTMWRFMAPAYRERFRVITYDLTGSGRSDLSAYDPERYGTLHGYADDLLEIVDAFATGPVILVGHSVSSMIGMLATIKAPERFAAQVMVAPSACYINDRRNDRAGEDYIGGFEREDIEELLETMDANYLGWSSSLAPAIMGAPERPDLREELTESFCRNDPTIARHFARVTFLSDHRPDLPLSTTPALILQCSDDLIAPMSAGDYLHRHLPRSVLHVIDNIGHCPHMSAPTASTRAIDAFLAELRH